MSVLVFVVAGLAGPLGSAPGCSSDAKPPAMDAGSSLTCQGIRLCMAAGASADSCAARGTAEGQAAFQKLRDCLTPLCDGLLRACVCRESCQSDGYCLAETDACVAASGSTVDAVCEQYCGG